MLIKSGYDIFISAAEKYRQLFLLGCVRCDFEEYLFIAGMLEMKNVQFKEVECEGGFNLCLNHRIKEEYKS